ncbi:putative Polyamine-modulated factor 1-binding protein 1 [Hibiscus syriacus]|uniref:Polyamine-modulated factor 1-binding protein 1 n=2 Tax=Hibiscus syriacus TaxID=106335 RepID=A0A6A3BHN5_HIBSY|nr:putative Polyamine-modulated factor 1-binding protein 1 [Hibiscus syriacus]
MGKKSNRRPVRYEKGQLGCMWGLITMFDFRHGRTTQRLLSDRRRGNSDAIGIGSSASLVEEKAMAMDTCKPSVKKLLEEEMSREQVANIEVNNTEHEAKEFGSGEGDNGRKNRNRRSKTHKKSYGNSPDVNAAKNLVLEVSCQHKFEQQTPSSLDVDNLVEEFRHDLPAEPNNSSFEERLSEVIKFLVSQKLINRNQLMEGGELQASKEVMDALQVLSLDEELFLKLLRDPNSLLVKYVKDLPDDRDGESKPLVGSNFSEQVPVGSRQSNEPVNRKQRNFFRRRSKSKERDLSDGNKIPEASTRIVVLKPGATCSQTPETGSSRGSSPDPKHIIRHREPHFFLAEIKRKWKHAMGREQRRIPTNEISKRVSGELKNSGDAGGFKEYITMNSPTKDHFFIERVAKPSTGAKRGERISKLKGSETSTDGETNFSRHSNIYIEAKKHLSVMLTDGDDNVDLSSRQVPKTLGRILSLPDYNSSPVGSPRWSSEPSFITTQMRFAGSDELDNVSHPRRAAEEHPSRLCVSDNKTGDEIEGDNIFSDKLNAFVNDDKVDQGDCSIKDETSSVGIIVQEETKLLDASSKTSITTDDKIVDVSEVYDEKQYPHCLKQELFEEDQQSFSPLASPSNSSVTKKVEGLESVSDLQERPSPVSVLEPIFIDDVISPASIRSISGETSIQPLRIRFEEHGSSANHSGGFKTCMDDKESILKHIKAVLQASSFDWDELYIRSLSSDQLLDPLLLDEVEYLPNQLCHHKKLVFDCINEVLIEVCGYYFGSPGVSFVKTNIRPLPNMKNTIEEIWQRVYWHVLPMPLPRTLDQLVRKDLAKTGTWMDLRLDADFISVEIGEAILEDLVEDTITSYVNVSPECEYRAEGLEE